MVEEMGLRGWAGVGLGFGVAFLARTGLAQEDAAADALFNKGLSDMEAGRYETACPALKESQRLDPRPGTLFTLAECEAKGGMFASAVAHYEDYLRQFARLTPAKKVAQGGREKISAAQKAALVPLVPYVTLALPKAAPSGTSVKWDSLTLNQPALGIPLPVNPGEHVATTQIPGGPAHEQRVSIQKGEKKQVELEIDLGVSQAEPAPATPRAATVSDSKTVGSTNLSAGGDATGRSSSRRTWTYVAAGVGGVGIAIGAVSGVLVLSKKSTIEDNCVDTLCNSTGKEAADSAKTLGLVSTIGFGVGAAGLATAAVLLITRPSATTVGRATAWTPVVSEGAGGVVMGVQRQW